MEIIQVSGKLWHYKREIAICQEYVPRIRTSEAKKSISIARASPQSAKSSVIGIKIGIDVDVIIVRCQTLWLVLESRGPQKRHHPVRGLENP